MTPADIERMAREAGIDFFSDGVFYASPDELARFAALVAAAERERCAKVCEGLTGRARDDK